MSMPKVSIVIASDDQITAIDGLETGRRGGPEPEAITMETFGIDIPEA